ncbi:AAA domain-containing protein [Pseudonocardia hierapolitana]|uniref:AAA domain-containing protein n=1 Tax=Pseudonocardia hierapolitana TaxID=1128676 RepID=A0A561SL78_9PSEU|nr:AAA domain-containing protein [Pseudonocardia hierapolitana]TWF75621.1 AAA domain-containing protein [Pseudonocardia hierapolitana]
MSPLIRRKALLIGNEHHDDDRFPPLPSTRADIAGLSQVLRHPSIGNFWSATTMSDLTADDMRQAIGEFLEDCGEGDLALVYVSGHGTRLVQTGGEFYFVARDTDFDRIADTGVAAGFINERLEACWAPQKVVMIDCCRSGGFAVGLRTSDQQLARMVAKSGEDALLTSRAVYVLSSSRAGEDSYAHAGPGEVRPSAFTGEVIEALRTGRVGTDGSGEVSVSDLFHYVNRKMRENGARQIPVHSALGVDDRIVIASCPLGAAPVLVPVSANPAAAPGAARPLPRSHRQPTWTDLLAYYKDCVLSDGTEMPLMSVGDHARSYVCLTGQERFLAGEVDDNGCADLPAEAASLVAAATEQDAELWAGFPAVVLTGPRGGQPWRHPKFAPLLVRRVEIVDTDGTVRLKPYGPVQPHPGLAREWLGAEEAANLTESYHHTWHSGQHDRMAVDIRNLITNEFELPCVQELRPDRLAERIDVRTPGHGARNVAVLFTALRNSKFTKKLVDDLDTIMARAAHIRSTALAVLSPDAAERAQASAQAEPTPARLVTPLSCNEAQRAVICSAMTRRLTVATGPPGTGKSQLVANVVATAIANVQTVLVASNNNEAVDEVWRRCEQLVPGSLVRTGSARSRTRDYTETENAALHALRAAPEPARNPQTAAAQLDAADGRLQSIRQEMARVSADERALLVAGQARENHAGQLGVPVAELVHRLADAAAWDRMALKATRLARARFLGRWRRASLLRKVGIHLDGGDLADRCHTLARFASAETTWRALRERGMSNQDAAIAAALEHAQADVRTASRDLLESTLRTNARLGRRRILALLTARDNDRSDWPAVKDILGGGHGRRTSPTVPGWAVTSLMARRFPPEPGLFDLVIIDEASQCGIPHVLPLLFRARRALVIGDAMQLPHIANIGAEREAASRHRSGVRADWLEKHHLAYRRHSAFHAAARSAGGTLLLDEHFRCHPDIAAVSNDLFYDSGLTVLTDMRNRPSLASRPIVWEHVAGRAARPAGGGSWVNRDEIVRVDDIVASMLQCLPAEATIGVVTPFTGQADALRRRLGRHGQERIRVGTVHTFQGGERDVMVFSLVAATGMHRGAIDWVDRQLNLWNVAITRARSNLIVVGDKDLWRRRGGVAAALLEASTGAVPTAGPGMGDDLLQRLYHVLTMQPGSAVSLGERVNGHPVEAVVRGGNGTTTAVLLDRGARAGSDEARHLRLALHRRALLDGAGPGHAAFRYPAWRLYDYA